MNIVLGLCLLAFSGQQVLALECYICAGCNDPFSADGVSKLSCGGSCAKSEKDGVVTRSCFVSTGKSDCEELAGINVCYCTEDLCNGASERYMSRISIIVTIVSVCTSVFKYVF